MCWRLLHVRLHCGMLTRLQFSIQRTRRAGVHQARQQRAAATGRLVAAAAEALAARAPAPRAPACALPSPAPLCPALHALQQITEEAVLQNLLKVRGRH